MVNTNNDMPNLGKIAICETDTEIYPDKQCREEIIDNLVANYDKVLCDRPGDKNWKMAELKLVKSLFYFIHEADTDGKLSELKEIQDFEYELDKLPKDHPALVEFQKFSTMVTARTKIAVFTAVLINLMKLKDLHC